jgi:hypothetical protein
MEQITLQQTKSANGDSIVLSILTDIGNYQLNLVRDAVNATPDRTVIRSENRLSPNREWLVNNAGQYTGKWVALRDGVLLETADNLSALAEALRNRGVKLPSSQIMITTGF